MTTEIKKHTEKTNIYGEARNMMTPEEVGWMVEDIVKATKSGNIEWHDNSEFKPDQFKGGESYVFDLENTQRSLVFGFLRREASNGNEYHRLDLFLVDWNNPEKTVALDRDLSYTDPLDGPEDPHTYHNTLRYWLEELYKALRVNQDTKKTIKAFYQDVRKSF